MKLKYIIILLLLVVVFSSCEDYLDRKDPSTEYIPEEDIWADKKKAESIVHRMYDCTGWWMLTHYDYEGRHSAGPSKNYGDIGILSGEYILTRAIHQLTQMVYGDWESGVKNSYSNPDFYDSWEDCWELVYVSNLMLDGLKNAVLDERFTEAEINQLKGESYLFRALGYFEITRRWGQMPYFTERMRPDMELNVPRPETFLENVNAMVADCDSAIMYIPEISYEGDPVYMGRCGKAAAYGLKAKILVTGASPAYVDAGNDAKALWERAASAAWDLIALSNTTEKLGLYEGNYVEIFHTLPGTIENVWPIYQAPKDPQWYWTSFLSARMGGYHGFSPSQELVERFETADGWDIKDPRSGHNPQDPYTNLDPRFYKDILYHGCEWAVTAEGQKIDMRTTPKGADRPAPGKFGDSETGYLVRKLVPEKWNKAQSAYNTSKYLNPPYMRMAEAYLIYAEATNEAWGPKQKAPGADLTAVEALNVIRDRVGQVGVREEYTGDQDIFRERVHNEYYVELCFEYHLWLDQLRWKEAEEYDNYNFHGVNIIEDASQPTGVRYEKFAIPIERHFDKNKHYRYPLRKDDLYLYDQWKQNPGWE